MHRRELLKTMAVSAPTLATVGWSNFMPKQSAENALASVRTLNVVFQGPMIFLMENPLVRVLVPRIDGHRYQIENRDTAAASFTLQGVVGVGDVSKTQYDLPNGSDAFRLSANQLHLNMDLSKQPYFAFSLPAPRRVVALSAREADIMDAFGNRRTAVMPTSYAFVYDVANAQSLALDPNPEWNPSDRVVQNSFTNLVIAGELPGNRTDPGGQHAHAAFDAMTSYFPGLKMHFFDSGPETKTGTVEGLPQELVQRQSQPVGNVSAPRAVPSVFKPGVARPGLVLASEVVDCKTGGIIVTKP